MPTTLTGSKIDRLAQLAVTEKLKLATLLYIHEADYLDFLVKAHRDAKEQLEDNNAAFFADVIPWVTSLIQVFVAQGDFLAAIEWAKAEFKETTKPISVLTVLTTTFLVHRGIERAKTESQAAQNTWKEIRKRLGFLPVE
ncbi:MAG TPA: hypothetical protein VK598_04760 [Nitrospiraceae bacterium]|nr:hypothetical protein [Nitrospiraceae bacterium]